MNKIYLCMLFLLSYGGMAWSQSSALYIGSGATFYTTGSNSIVTLENAGLFNNGSLTANGGTVVFIGDATNEDSNINGTGTTSFRNLTVDKSANDVQINQNISVSGNLTLAAGGVELYGGNVDFGTTGSLQSETASNRVWGEGGYLRRVATLNAPSGINLGNLGAELTSTQNLGSTEVRRSHIPANINSGGVARRYVITPTNNSGLNAKLRFYYWDSELNGNDEATMVLWRSTDNGTSWTAQSTTGKDGSSNWIEATGINAFSMWTAANANVLPVELLSFEGKSTERGNVLTWETSSETNNDGFDVEASQDGVRFGKIGFVKGNGTTNDAKRYSFTDEKVVSGLTYYRLKQIDFDGKFEYSDIISLLRRSDKFSSVGVFPNPTSDVLNVVVETKNDDMLEFTLLDILGRTIRQQKITTQHGLNAKTLDLSDLPSGAYFLQLQQGDERIVRKVIKE